MHSPSMDTVLFPQPLCLAIMTSPFVYGIPSSMSPSTSAPTPLSTVTIAGQALVVDPANFVLDGATIKPGSAGISIHGQIVSADAPDDLYVDRTEIMARPIGPNYANTAINSFGSSSVTPSSMINSAGNAATTSVYASI